MTMGMKVSSLFLVLGVACFINLTYFDYITGWIVLFYQKESVLAIEIVKLQAALMAMLGFGYFLKSYSEKLEAEARQNPLVIEVSKNTAMGSWGKRKDIMIGAPFSADKDLVANSDLLVKAIDQIVRTYRKEKGGSKTGLFVAIKATPIDGFRVSEGEISMLGEVIEKSIAKSGPVFVR